MGILTGNDYNGLKQQVLDETKRGGNSQNAIALAILALAEALKGTGK